MWWSGLPPSIRGKVWQLAIDNRLNITQDMYQDYVAKAKQKLQEAQMRRKRLKINRKNVCACRKQENPPQGEKTEEPTITVQEEILPNTEEKLPSNEDFLPKPEDSIAKTEEWLAKTEEQLPENDAMPIVEEKLPIKEESVARAEEWLSKTENLLASTEENLPTTSDMDLPINKPRLSIPRNFSEQNLKSHTMDSPKKCCSKSNPNLLEYSDECSMELIQLDIARTFPHLCIFQPGGPYFDVLHELLAAYVCYRPDIGYVQVSILSHLKIKWQ